MGKNNLPNKKTALAVNQKISEGVDKYFSKVKSLTVGGTTYTPKSLLAVLAAENDASSAVDSTRAQLVEQVATHREAKASAGALRAELRAYILGTSGKKALQMLGDFGMSTPKPMGKKSVEAKAQALAQAKATREARHTMGKKQRLSIKGIVPTQSAETGTSSSSAPAETPTQVAQATSPAQTTQAPPPGSNGVAH